MNSNLWKIRTTKNLINGKKPMHFLKNTPLYSKKFAIETCMEQMKLLALEIGEMQFLLILT